MRQILLERYSSREIQEETVRGYAVDLRLPISAKHGSGEFIRLRVGLSALGGPVRLGREQTPLVFCISELILTGK